MSKIVKLFVLCFIDVVVVLVLGINKVCFLGNV